MLQNGCYISIPLRIKEGNKEKLFTQDFEQTEGLGYPSFFYPYLLTKLE